MSAKWQQFFLDLNELISINKRFQVYEFDENVWERENLLTYHVMPSKDWDMKPHPLMSTDMKHSFVRRDSNTCRLNSLSPGQVSNCKPISKLIFI